jgi:hypothetical protein
LRVSASAGALFSGVRFINVFPVGAVKNLSLIEVYAVAGILYDLISQVIASAKLLQPGHS